MTQEKPESCRRRGLPDAINSQIDHLRADMFDRTKNAYERERIQERLAHLAGSIATIKVGELHTEIDERKYSAVSAMHSVRAAIEGGWNYGGGVGLLNARSVLAGQPEQHRSRPNRNSRGSEGD